MNKEDYIYNFICRLNEEISCREFCIRTLVSAGTSSNSTIFARQIGKEQEKLRELEQQLEEARRQYHKAKPFQN